MGRIVCLSILLILLFSTFASALSWAYIFVVHDGKVYEVKEDMSINQTELGNAIGEVETKADEESGDYYGNASNHYEIGTRYFNIEGVSINEAIAVETKVGYYVKAVYIHDAPSTFKNILLKNWSILGIALVLLVGITVLKSKQT